MEGARWNKRTDGVRTQKRPYSRTTGRRVDVSTDRASVNAARRGGQRIQEPRKGEGRRVRQMAISAILLVLVVTVKLAFPNVMEQYRHQLLKLLGEDTDFVAAFSAVGRTVSPDGKLSNALNDAYTAVFGSEKVVLGNENEKEAEANDPQESADSSSAQEEGMVTTEDGQVIYTTENTPENACMTQKLLGFAYAPPVEGTITSGFGYRVHPILGEEKFHYGMDIGAESGTVIHAFAAGTVTVVAESSMLGKYVIVSHPGGYTSLYGHCSTVTASSGQQVARGDPIAEVGDTGQTTGPHLHFELQQENTYLNPVYYVAG